MPSVKLDYIHIISTFFKCISLLADKKLYLILPFWGVIDTGLLSASLDTLSHFLVKGNLIQIKGDNRKNINKFMLRAMKKTLKRKKALNRDIIRKFSDEFKKFNEESRYSSVEEAFIEAAKIAGEESEHGKLMQELRSIFDDFLNELSHDREASAYIILKEISELSKYASAMMTMMEDRYTFSKLVADRRSYLSEKRPHEEYCDEYNLREWDRIAFSIPFVGRDEELRHLTSFLDFKDNLSWWAVTGDAGIGKSRLVNQFLLENKENEEWIKITLPSRFFKDSAYKTYKPWKCASNLLMIIDGYVDAKIYGEFLQDLKETESHRPYKIRLLYVEREHKTEGGGNPAWLERITDIDEGLSLPKMYQQTTLKAKPLEQNHIVAIIKSYFEIRKKGRAFSPYAQKIIIEKLKEMDENMIRPLFALALSSAYNQGVDIDSGGRMELFEWIYEREAEYIKTKLQVDSTKADAVEAWFKLLTYATAIAPLELREDKIPEYLKGAYNVLLQKAGNIGGGIGLSDLMKITGAAEVIKSPDCIFDNIYIKPIKPDLIGEYFVLADLQKNSEGYRDAFLYEVWRHCDSNSILSRLARDFPDHPLVDLKKLLREPDFECYEDNEKTPTSYAILLADCASCGNYDALEILEDLAKRIDIKSIWLVLTNGLFNSLYHVDGNTKKEIVNRLEGLAKAKDIDDVWIAFAYGLVVLSYDADDNTRIEIMNQLKDLAEIKNINSIWVIFAKGLVSFSASAVGNTQKEIVNRLEDLAETKNINDIWIEFANGLVNLSARADGNTRKESMNRLEDLAVTKNINEIWIAFAKGLVNLSYDADGNTGKEIVNRLEDLAVTKDINDIWILFAKGLFNLSISAEGGTRKEIVNRLEDLAETKNINDIWIEFAKGLLNLSISAEGDTRKEIVNRLEELAETKNINDIWIEFAKGLVNLSCHADGNILKESVNRLENLAEAKDINDIWILFANGLVNLSAIADGNTRKEIVNRLEYLAETKNINDIWIAFAKGLVHLTAFADDNTRKESVNILENLAETKNINDIWILFANGLFNLSFIADGNTRKESVNRLEGLAGTKNINDIWIFFAMGLVRLSALADDNARKESVNILENLAETKNINDIWILFAKGLFNLSCIADGNTRKESVNRLEVLAETKNNNDIWIEFAKGLVNLFFLEETATQIILIVKKLKSTYERTQNIDIFFYYAGALVQGYYKFDIQDEVWSEESFFAEMEVKKLLKENPALRTRESYQFFSKARTL